MLFTVDLNDNNYRASTVAIGSVTTGPVPSVTNAGTPRDAVFNFVLPKGEQGTPGTPGKAATLKIGSMLLMRNMVSCGKLY